MKDEVFLIEIPPLKGGHRGVAGSMTYKYLPRNRSLRPLAAKLRAEATKEERILWKKLSL